MCNNRYINNSFNNNANNWDDLVGTSSYSRLPSNLRYGNAYVPVQTLRTVYSPAERIIIWYYVSRISFSLFCKSVFS